MLYSSINGIEDQYISISDRALAYGDGLFTTAKIFNGEIQRLNEHIERLQSGCQQLGICQPDYIALKANLIDAVKPYELAVLKVVVSAGQGGRGYSRKGVTSPNVIVTVNTFPEHYLAWAETGITLSDCSLTIGLNPLLQGIKHLNRLEQVLIRQELDTALADDLLVTNVLGQVIETSCANVFWLKNEVLYTPSLEQSGVNGLVRQKILNTFTNVQVVTAELNDIDSVEGMFICNSVMGIVPVKQYNQTQFSITAIKNIQMTLEEKLKC